MAGHKNNYIRRSPTPQFRPLSTRLDRRRCAPVVEVKGRVVDAAQGGSVESGADALVSGRPTPRSGSGGRYTRPRAGREGRQEGRIRWASGSGLASAWASARMLTAGRGKRIVRTDPAFTITYGSGRYCERAYAAQEPPATPHMAGIGGRPPNPRCRPRPGRRARRARRSRPASSRLRAAWPRCHRGSRGRCRRRRAMRAC